jgi:cytochrome c oxidase subunit 2
MDAALRLLLLFGMLAGVAIVVFMAVVFSTWLPSREQAQVQKRAYAIRGWWFGGLLLIVFAAFASSIPFFPYVSATAALAPALRVPVIAEQYTFLMPSHLPANQPLIFEVTSRDVNHGLGIYDPEGRLVGQVQAMPDYTNYLRLVFHKRGRYTARCLEYCGPGHALMEKAFTVGDEK